MMNLFSMQERVSPEKFSVVDTRSTHSSKREEKKAIYEHNFSQTLEKVVQKNQNKKNEIESTKMPDLEEIKSSLCFLLENPETQTLEAVEKLLHSLFVFLQQGSLHLQDGQKAQALEVLTNLKNLLVAWENKTLTTETFLKELMAWLENSDEKFSLTTFLVVSPSPEITPTPSNANLNPETRQKPEDKSLTNTENLKTKQIIRVVDKRNLVVEKSQQESFSSYIEHLINKLETKEITSFSEINLIERNKPTQDFGIKATPSLPRVSVEQMLQQVAGKALITLRDGQSEMRLQFNPPDLGRMEMKIILEDGQMMGKIVVSTPEAKALFDQNLGELQRQLQQAGVKVGNLDVSLGQPGGEKTPNAPLSENTGFLLETGDLVPAEEGRSPFLWADSRVNYIV